MNYWERHIGDWLKDTAILTLMEEGTYTRLCDSYYATEKPLPVELAACHRVARAYVAAERKAVKYILETFFRLESDGWHHKRIDAEIARFRDKSEKARGSANARWANTKSDTSGNANAYANGHANASVTTMRTHSERTSVGNALQSPVSSLRPERGASPPASRVKAARKPPAEFEPDRVFALAELPDLDIEREVARFRDCEFKTPRSDWAAAWRNWVRNAKDRGQYAKKATNGSHQSLADQGWR